MDYRTLVWEYSNGPSLNHDGPGWQYATSNADVTLENALPMIKGNIPFLRDRGFYGDIDEVIYGNYGQSNITQGFRDWFDSSGLIIGVSWPKDGYSYWSFFEGGKPIGAPMRVIVNTTIMDMLSPVFFAIAGPIAAGWSISSQIVVGATGNKDLGAVMKVAQIASGDIGAGDLGSDVTSGASNMDDLDFNFDSFDYSDGEAFTAFSDAENVDFGFDTGDGSFEVPSDIDSGTLDIGDENSQDVVYGATAESEVSDYGTINESGSFQTEDFKKYADGLKVADQIQKATSPNDNRQTNAGGGTKFSQTAPSVSKVIAQATAKSQGSSPSILDTIGGVMRQVETALPRQYVGQLGPNKSGVNPQQNMTLIYIGGALIAVALLLHAKG